MAGKLATIISLGINLPLQERAIYKALHNTRTETGTNVRVQPIKDDKAYLVVEHKKSKAIAENSFNALVKAYLEFGGIEYNEDVLDDNSPEPSMAYISDEGAHIIPSMAELRAKFEEAKAS